MPDYDLYHNVKPVFGTPAETLLDGLTFTPWIDTQDWKSIMFIAALHAAAQHRDVDWSLQESDDGVTGAAVDADMLHLNPPADTSLTSKVFSAGYRGKRRYVRAAFDCDGVTAAALDLVESGPMTLTSLTSSGTTATATKVGHGLTTGMKVTISGAAQSEYNVAAKQITVADADTFTFTLDSDPSINTATGTIVANFTAGWTDDPGATPIASLTAGAAALSGNYQVSVVALTAGSAAATVTRKNGNTGDGALTVSNINAAGASALLGETLKFVCTAESADAGTFAAYREDGSALGVGTIEVGATGVTFQVGGVNAFKLVIADGATDWAEDDEVYVTITDLGKNKYKLTDPDGRVIGYPLGTIAFTSTHLNFTVPDTIPVSQTDALATIVVDRGLAYGQVTALLGHPQSGPLFQQES